MKNRKSVGQAAAQAQSQAMAMFETGSDPFGRPVAWATEERTGEQSTFTYDHPSAAPVRAVVQRAIAEGGEVITEIPAPVHGSWCGTPCGRPGAEEAHAPVSSPIRGDLLEVLDNEHGWHGPYPVTSGGATYVLVAIDGRSHAYATTDTRRVSQ